MKVMSWFTPISMKVMSWTHSNIHEGDELVQLPIWRVILLPIAEHGFKRRAMTGS